MLFIMLNSNGQTIHLKIPLSPIPNIEKKIKDGDIYIQLINNLNHTEDNNAHIICHYEVNENNKLNYTLTYPGTCGPNKGF